jgi:undecaprenyl phosphate-alpha-L-ara4N flippase subunit ArnE
MVFSSMCVCIGQLCWKLSASGNAGASGGASALYLCAGFLLYGIGALAMLAAYKFGSLSILQPILSINYPFTIILARLVLNEAITVYQIIGIIIITGSVILIGSSDY